ncbi:hypothetical protein N7532_000256 [Penicillium argentinense]|uniref:Uncharacterized protein n=1 Tax=Penicillium argentinense TaxID=1131581 RepID=A0A9W9G4W7_9EURO|nr:uncharacterized protein N7532_000256 [Penicillium argentinense]KAJ5112211.1 hypothetical protein N7532_000256 [Penicillium argentinense]
MPPNAVHETCPPSKRQKTNHIPYSTHLSIENTDRDFDRRPESGRREWKHRLIPKTNSTEWGAGQNASDRAGLVSETNEYNERLLRTYHRSLSKSDVVLLVSSPFGDRFWSVSRDAADIKVGGLFIHITPLGYYPTTQLLKAPRTFFPQLTIDGYINPRKFLTDADLHSLQALFPESVGARIFISGFLCILFPTVTTLKRANCLEFPPEIGGLPVLLDIADFTLTAQDVESGAALADEEAKSTACLGLKIRLPDGTTALTTVTHAFIPNPSRCKFNLRIADWITRAINALSQFRNPLLGHEAPAFGKTHQSRTDDIIGKELRLFTTNAAIGKITRCYDNPSRILPYPSGYHHDLSLIQGNALPDVMTPPGYPPISEWAPHSEVLAGAPLYATAMNAKTQRWRVIEGEKVPSVVENAVLLGSQYFWEREAYRADVSLLWRTVDHVDSASGYSGSVLCTGVPGGSGQGKAALFQNFEAGLRVWNNPPMFANIKGGFLLPTEIRNSVIVARDPQPQPQYNTLPQHSRLWTHGRRSLSGP